MASSRESITIPSDKATLAYIAGIIDGEGCISVSKQSTREGKPRESTTHSPKIIISNTDARLFIWLRDVLGVCNVHPTSNSRMSDSYRECWSLYLAGSNCDRLLIAVLPYLVLKREQALLCLGFRQIGISRQGKALPENVVDMREAVYQRVKSLNKRGVA